MFIPLKLQLFAEEIDSDTSVDNQGVAEPETEPTIDGDGILEEPSVKEPDGIADRQPDKPKLPTRDFEKDSAYAKMRREAEQLKKEKELLEKSLQQFGFKGTPEEISDQALAHYFEKPVEEIRRERLAKEQESKLEQELNYYKEQEALRLMNEDLKKIQAIDPTVKSLEELDPRYFQLVANGLDGESAFVAVQQLVKKEKKIPPVEIGKVNSSTKAVKDYYSKDEVDRMTEAELDDPKIWQRVRNSMTKW